jgi:hypothetical protein
MIYNKLDGTTSKSFKLGKNGVTIESMETGELKIYTRDYVFILGKEEVESLYEGEGTERTIASYESVQQYIADELANVTGDMTDVDEALQQIAGLATAIDNDPDFYLNVLRLNDKDGEAVDGQVVKGTTTFEKDITLEGKIIGGSTLIIDPRPESDPNDILGTVVIHGDLQVDGTTTTINSTTVDIADKNITLAKGSANAAAANGAGITIDGTSLTQGGPLASMLFNGSNNSLNLNRDLYSPRLGLGANAPSSLSSVFQITDNSGGYYELANIEGTSLANEDLTGLRVNVTIPGSDYIAGAYGLSVSSTASGNNSAYGASVSASTSSSNVEYANAIGVYATAYSNNNAPAYGLYVAGVKNNQSYPDTLTYGVFSSQGYNYFAGYSGFGKQLPERQLHSAVGTYSTDYSSVMYPLRLERDFDYTTLKIFTISTTNNKLTGGDTSNLKVGMVISGSFYFPSGTYIVSIDSPTQLTASNNALRNGLQYISFILSASPGIGSGIEFSSKINSSIVQGDFVNNTKVTGAIESILTNNVVNSENFDMIFKTMGLGSEISEKMRITGVGNVGIGTSSPSSKLDVLGNALIQLNEPTGQSSTLKVLSTENGSGNYWRGRAMFGAQNLTFLMGVYNNLAGLGAHSWTNAKDESGAAWADFYLNPDGDKAVYIGKGASAWTANNGIMKIDNATGRVGIGTMSPTEILDVNGVVKGMSLTSTVATGTAPLTVSSTTVVSNLNADLLDGQHGSYYAVDSEVVKLAGDQTIGGTKTFSSTITGSVSGNAGSATLIATTQKSDNINYNIPFLSSTTAGNQALYTDSAQSITFNPSTDMLNVPNLTVTGTVTVNNVDVINTSSGVIFDGATANSAKTTLNVVDPTESRSILLPNASGTVALTSQIDNIINGTTGLVNTRITNSAVGVSPLIVNGVASTTADLQRWNVNNVNQARITSSGEFYGFGVSNLASFNNSYISLSNDGTRITRNVDDTNPALIVRKQQGTGNILELQTGTSDKKFEIDVNGWFYQNGTRLFHQTANGTFFGLTSGELNGTGVFNTGIGEGSLRVLTSGNRNTAVGRNSLSVLTTGSNNVAIGESAGIRITTGSNNLFLGRASGDDASQPVNVSNSTALGYQAYTDKSNQMVFGNASVTEYLFGRGNNARINLNGSTTAFGIALDVSSANSNIYPGRFTRLGNNSSQNGTALVLSHQLSGSQMVNDFGTNLSFEILDSDALSGNTVGRIGTLRSGADNSGRMVFETANAGSITEKMTILPNGNVGIGTASPAFPSGSGLVVYDSSIARVDLKNSATGLLGSDGSGIAAFNNDFYVYNRENAKIFFDTQSTTRMTIDGSGNVGIGITNPTNMLTIQKTATGAMGANLALVNLGTSGTVGNAVSIDFGLENSTYTDTQSNAQIKAILEGANNSSSLAFSTYNGTAFGERLRILGNGNVGIGTSSPTRKLEIVAGGTTMVSQFITNQASSFLSFSNSTSTADQVRLGSTGSNLVLSTNFLERLRVDNTGLVGINETTPTAQLQVKSGATDRVPLVVDSLTSHGTNLQEWRINGVSQVAISQFGVVIAPFFSNSSSNNALINTATTGTTISRNIGSSDANPALIVNLAHTDSTGNIVNFNSNIGGTTATRASIDKSGNISGSTLVSTVATGTAPLSVASTTKVNNLYVDRAEKADKIATTQKSDNVNYQVPFVSSVTAGNQDLFTDSAQSITFNPSTDMLNVPNLTVTGNITVNNVEMVSTSSGVIFEGATVNDFETTLNVVDPTEDRTILLPNASGTVALTSQVDNIVNGTTGLVDTRITNSANNIIPLIINALPSTTGNFTEWRDSDGIMRTGVESGGNLIAAGVRNFSNTNNAWVQTLSTGVVVLRNINDTNVPLIVRKAQGTGNIFELQTGSGESIAKKLEVDVNGWFYQNGTRFITNPGTQNIFVGISSGSTSAAGAENTSLGFQSLANITSGNGNTSIGRNALLLATTGGHNTAVGNQAGRTITTGGNNTFIGREAGFNASQLATASNSTGIGFEAFTTKDNQIVLGNASVTEIKLDRNSSAVVLAPNASFSGNIGVGTVAPTEKIDVVGNVKVSENVTAKNVTASEKVTSGEVVTNVIRLGNFEISSNDTVQALVFKRVAV